MIVSVQLAAKFPYLPVSFTKYSKLEHYNVTGASLSLVVSSASSSVSSWQHRSDHKISKEEEKIFLKVPRVILSAASTFLSHHHHSMWSGYSITTIYRQRLFRVFVRNCISAILSYFSIKVNIKYKSLGKTDEFTSLENSLGNSIPINVMYYVNIRCYT